MESYFYAIWKKNCWKCGKEITVAIDVCGWSFVPCDTLDYEEYQDEESYAGGLWRYKLPSWLLKHLKSLGANIQFRITSRVKNGYYANVCPYCGAVQGDWFLHEEFIGLIYEKPPRFKIYEITEKGPSLWKFNLE